MEKQNNHELHLISKKKLQVSGVQKIESLNSEEFIINTNMGTLIIIGDKLVMQQLDIDKGNIWIDGIIHSISYVQEHKQVKEKNSFLGKIFK